MGGMITLHAMSLVYTTMLSIVPLLAVSISVLKGFGVHDQLEPTLVRLLQPIGEQNVEISARIVGFVENMKLGVLGSVGLLLLLYTAVSLIRKIEFAFNHSWRLQNNRRPMQRFGNYLSVIVVGPVLVFAAVGITALLGNSHVVDFLNGLPYMNNLLRVSGKLLPFVLVIAAFTFVYMLVPNTRVQFRSAFYGAVVAGVLWQALGIVFTSFVGGSSSYTAIYSGLAILLVFMIWLYLSWIILLIGSGISFYHQHPEYLKWEKLDLHLSTRMRDQLALQAMVNIARAHDDRQFAGGLQPWQPGGVSAGSGGRAAENTECAAGRWSDPAIRGRPAAIPAGSELTENLSVRYTALRAPGKGPGSQRGPARRPASVGHAGRTGAEFGNLSG